MAALAALSLTMVAPATGAHADTGDTWAYPSRLDDGLTAARLDRCRLGFVAQAGGPAIRSVAQTGLTGTTAAMHTAADPSYWNATPLSTAYDQDRADYSAKVDTLYGRKDVWSDSIPNNFEVVDETVTGFQWAPNFYGDLGILSFYNHRFFDGEGSLYEDLAPVGSAEAVASAVAIAKAQGLYTGSGGSSYERWAWGEVGDEDPFNDGHVYPGNHHADDLRLFLQAGGFPKSAPAPGSTEFRLEVEAIKQRFASCDTDNPLDPNHVLAPVVHTAAAEWQAELDSQATQRAAILAAHAKAYLDLENAAIAMGEAVGQSWIAHQLTKWQSCWSAGGLCTAGSGPITFKYKPSTTFCLDNTSGSATNNNKIELWTCNNGTAQQWRPYGYNYLDGPLYNAATGKCLDLNGTNVVLYACTTNKANQHWQWSTTGGLTRLYNVGANKCLDFASATNGLAAAVKTCTGGTTQQFVSAQNNAGTGTGTDILDAPKAADFTYAVNEIKNAQNRAAAQLTIANNAAADAQVQATAVTNAQNAAATIATAGHYPVGRGLAYAQQSAQVVKASAAGTTAAAKATATAVQATKAAVADSDTLLALAKTQATAMRAEYAKNAAQEAARQAQAAAQSAAAEATAAARDAATAKAKRAEAEQARATAKIAADQAAAQRKIAEQQRDVAAQQRRIAESRRADAAAADAEAQRQLGIAGSARASADADAVTAADRDHDAQVSANNAMIARETAENANAKHDSLAARAMAMQAKADALAGTDQAAAARAAADHAQQEADRAQDAADAAGRAADTATRAAEDAREAATRAHAAAARSEAAAKKADAQVGITRAAMAKAHSAAADALAASRDAKAHANAADADAAAAAAAMRVAAQQSAAAWAAAQQAQLDSAVTAGKAYATSLAALAARDSAAQVATPANEAIALGAPFVERDSAAALAVLVGQSAMTVAQQQSAAADARAADAATAAGTAAALAAAAVGDAKIAAQAAADAAASASAAAKSARDARASAAAAAADAAAAATADAETAQLNAQAERDAAAAHAASQQAAGEADAADAAADSAERDAASARSAATQAQQEADAAQDAADRADASADDAEAAAQRAREDAAAAETAASSAEADARYADRMNQVVATWDGGYMALMLRPDLTVDAWEGHCSTGNGSPTCDIDVPLHMHGFVYYDLIICTLTGTTSATCGSLPLAVKTVDTTVHRTLHMDVRDQIKASWDNLVHLVFGDFIECGKKATKGDILNSSCAWAAAELIPYDRVFAWVKGVVEARAALRAGQGITDALEVLRASDLPAEALPLLEREASAATRLLSCAANAAAAARVTARVTVARAAQTEICPVDLLTAAGKASYQLLRAAVERARARSAADFRAMLGPGEYARGKTEPWLRSMYVGTALEKMVADDAAVLADANIEHLGAGMRGQSLPDFVIEHGEMECPIDVTGGSATSIRDHLNYAFVIGRDQIIDYPSFSADFLAEIFS